MTLGSRSIGPGNPCFLIAELSANHGRNYETAARTLEAMQKAGADAVKVQTYTADTLTLACDRPEFRVNAGSQWDGRTLHELYQEGAMPWEWQPKLQRVANDLGLEFLSSPFDASAVDFLESLGVPAHKVASFELVDIPLLERIAATGKPVIVSTGMASEEEINEAVAALKCSGAGEIALLHCTSAYPASAEQMNLRTLQDLADRFDVVVGLSDHSVGLEVPIAAVSLGAAMIEKHFILDRAVGGPDASFSLEPREFEQMVQAIRRTEAALGGVHYGPVGTERGMLTFRRSLFISRNVKAGDILDAASVRSVRPAHGLHTRHYAEVLGRRVKCDLEAGTPLAWDLLTDESAS